MGAKKPSRKKAAAPKGKLTKPSVPKAQRRQTIESAGKAVRLRAALYG